MMVYSAVLALFQLATSENEVVNALICCWIVPYPSEVWVEFETCMFQ